MQAVILYGALLAASYAGYQAWRAGYHARRTRVESLRPYLIAHEAQFVPAGRAAHSELKENQSTDISAVGLKVVVENIGPGPALRCRFEGWVTALSHRVSALTDRDTLVAAEVRESDADFFMELAGVAPQRRARPMPWLQTRPFEDPFTGDLWVHWRLSYRDVLGGEHTSWGSSYFESQIEGAHKEEI